MCFEGEDSGGVEMRLNLCDDSEEEFCSRISSVLGSADWGVPTQKVDWNDVLFSRVK